MYLHFARCRGKPLPTRGGPGQMGLSRYGVPCTIFVMWKIELI